MTRMSVFAFIICDLIKAHEKSGVHGVIATLSDWLESFAPVVPPTRNKTKTNRTLYARSFQRFE